MIIDNRKKENPLISILFNILIPVVILKNGDGWIGGYLDYDVNNLSNSQVWILSTPSIVFLAALFCPIIYFLYDLFKRKNINLISILGFVNVLLTGGIGIFGAQMGLSKNWFIIKEGSLPLVIGLLFIMMSKFKRESFNAILLNEQLFDTHKINTAVPDHLHHEFESILQKAGHHLTAGFFISSIIQFILASFIVVSNPGDSSFNEQVSTMTWVSYIAVMVPTLLIVGRGFMKLLTDLERVTSLNRDDFIRS